MLPNELQLTSNVTRRVLSILWNETSKKKKSKKRMSRRGLMAWTGMNLQKLMRLENPICDDNERRLGSRHTMLKWRGRKQRRSSRKRERPNGDEKNRRRKRNANSRR